MTLNDIERQGSAWRKIKAYVESQIEARKKELEKLDLTHEQNTAIKARIHELRLILKVENLEKEIPA